LEIVEAPSRSGVSGNISAISRSSVVGIGDPDRQRGRFRRRHQRCRLQLSCRAECFRQETGKPRIFSALSPVSQPI